MSGTRRTRCAPCPGRRADCLNGIRSTIEACNALVMLLERAIFDSKKASVDALTNPRANAGHPSYEKQVQ